MMSSHRNYERIYAILVEEHKMIRWEGSVNRGRATYKDTVGMKFKEIQKRAEQHLADISDKKEQHISKQERRRSAIEALDMLKHKKPAKDKPQWRGKNK